MGNLTSTLTVKLIDGVSGPAKGAAGSLGSIGKATEALGKIKVFKEQTSRLDEMSRAHEKARGTVKQLASQLIAAEAPSKRLQAAYERATQAVDKLGNRIDWQKARVRGAAAELERMGVATNNLAGSEARLHASIDRTTAAMRRQEAAAARWRGRREAAGALAAGAGIAVGAGTKNIGKKAVVSIAEFDIASRKQREFSDISEAAQSKLLLPQAKKIGQDTQFSNLDIVKAQTKAMQGLPSNITGDLKAEIGRGIIENVKNYALVMEADMEQAAEAIRSYLQATGKDISTKEKALAEANKATNQLVKMAKLGGMSDEDVQQYIKFAASSGTAAGLTPESMMSLGALARRGGLRGDEAGVFIRSTASKLVLPTKKGRAALAAAGINFDKYRAPSRVSVDNLETQFRNDLGKGFSPDVREKLGSIAANPALLSNRGKFIEAVTEATAKEFARGKGGTVLRADRNRVAKSAGTAFDAAGGNVDTERLLDDAMQKNMSLAQLNAWLTDKHGGKGAITQRQWDEFRASREEIRKSGNDPDFAKKKADEIMGGVGGSFEQAKGAIDNFVLSIGEANKGLIKFGLDGFSNVLGSFESLSTNGQRAATAIGLLAGGVGAVVGGGKLLSLVTGGTALAGSAAALDGSAAALTRAAIALGGSGVGGAAGGAAGAGGTAAAVTKMGWLARLGVAGVALGAYFGIRVIGEANEKRYEGVAPGEVHNKGREQRRAGNAAIRQQFLEERRRLGILPDQGDVAGTQAGENAGSGIAAGITASAATIEAAASSIWSAVKKQFGVGIDVPIRPTVSPANPTATPAPNKSSSYRGGDVTIQMNGVTGDANEIAEAVSRKVAEATAESLRGSFSDSEVG